MAVFPHASVAVHVRVTVNAPAHDPGVVTSTKVNVTAEHVSEAVAWTNVGAGGLEIVSHERVIGSGSGSITWNNTSRVPL